MRRAPIRFPGPAVRLAALAVVTVVTGCRGPRADPLADLLRARGLMVPVAGVAPSAVPDTFAAPRDGGRRRHQALDIPAPRGTPVVAADDGRIWKIERNRRGGLVVYAVDPDERLLYYYAHLSAYRRGLAEGERVRRGDVVGYVGSTGNADAAGPHLHFQVTAFDRDRWWEGRAIDPRPFLVTPGRVLRRGG